jgi:hypothetical protein
MTIQTAFVRFSTTYYTRTVSGEDCFCEITEIRRGRFQFCPEVKLLVNGKECTGFIRQKAVNNEVVSERLIVRGMGISFAPSNVLIPLGEAQMDAYKVIFASCKETFLGVLSTIPTSHEKKVRAAVGL